MECWFLLYAACISGCISHGLSLRCYHCQAHTDCLYGVCDYGIVCVTAVVGLHVSKGCLEASNVHLNVSTGCKTTRWFGSEVTICYCDHEDFCNTANNLLTFSPSKLAPFGLMFAILKLVTS
uniref:Protein sleepless n=1 Tax=Trichuris muris TaxID=70415 RepID=A0A5S6Q8I8_TRIMR